MKNNINKLLVDIYTYLLSYSFIPNWLIPKNAKTILDVGCGNGLPMKLISYHHKLISLGIDIYQPYIDSLKAQHIHNEYLLLDVSKAKLPSRRFDVSICFQVIEHMSKKSAYQLIKSIESITDKLVIFSTPIGKTEYKTEDGNIYQEHKSYFDPKEFEKLGYKIIKVGGKSLFGSNGLIYKVRWQVLRKLIFILDIMLMPLYMLFSKYVNYYYFAYKRLE